MVYPINFAGLRDPRQLPRSRGSEHHEVSLKGDRTKQLITINKPIKPTGLPDVEN
ncbi:MAG: hypothetical protein ACYTXC_16170 [Nostoc sp.]